jgi:hypothetical protein
MKPEEWCGTCRKLKRQAERESPQPSADVPAVKVIGPVKERRRPDRPTSINKGRAAKETDGAPGNTFQSRNGLSLRFRPESGNALAAGEQVGIGAHWEPLRTRWPAA